MDWPLVYRDEGDMAALAGVAPPGRAARQRVYRERNGNIVFLEIGKEVSDVFSRMVRFQMVSAGWCQLGSFGHGTRAVLRPLE
jgi:hypothetical protein